MWPDANALTIGIFATLAQHERELISTRTKAALQAKKAQGARLGKPENLMAQGQQKGGETTRRNALTNPAKRRAVSVAEMMYQAGNTYVQIADHLNGTGFLNVRGCAFQATKVRRLLKRQQTTAPATSILNP